MEDIPILSYSFLKEFSQKFDKQILGISSDALAILESYKWKGNIRELRNVMERVALLIEENEVKEHHLSSLISNVKNEKEDDNFVLNIPPKGIKIELVLKTLILKTLKITNGNQVKAAKILGLSRSKLRYQNGTTGN